VTAGKVLTSSANLRLRVTPTSEESRSRKKHLKLSQDHPRSSVLLNSLLLREATRHLIVQALPLKSPLNMNTSSRSAMEPTVLCAQPTTILAELR